MTDGEFLKMAQKALSLSPNSTEGAKRLFLRTIKKDKKALSEANSFFQSNFQNLYDASSNTLIKFVQVIYGQKTKEEAERGLKKDTGYRPAKK